MTDQTIRYFDGAGNKTVEVTQLRHRSGSKWAFAFSLYYGQDWIGERIARWTPKSTRETRPKIV